MMATFWLQAQLGAASIATYRIASIALHLSVGFVFLRFLRRFAISPRIALVTSWLFLVHPVVTEPVMFIAARAETLGVLCSLGAVMLWPPPQTAGALPRRLLAALLVLCAFFAKELYLVAPLLVALTHLVWHRDRLKTRAGARQAVWLLLLCAAIALGFALRSHLGIDSDSPLRENSLASLLRSGASLLAHYGELVGSLCNGATFAPYEPISAVAAALVLVSLSAAGAALLWFWWRSEPASLAWGAAWVGLVWVVVSLAPLVLFVPVVRAYQNRYAYFPLLGVLLTLAALTELVGPSVAVAVSKLGAARAAIYVAAVGLLGVTVATTRLEASLWRDDLTFFGNGADREPNNGIALYHYGYAVLSHAGCAKALPIFQDAARHAPNYPRAWQSVAGCLILLHRYEQALQPAVRALELAPDLAASHFNLGAVLARTGHRDEGLVEFRRALALDPMDPETIRHMLDFLATHLTLPDE